MNRVLLICLLVYLFIICSALMKPLKGGPVVSSYKLTKVANLRSAQ